MSASELTYNRQWRLKPVAKLPKKIKSFDFPLTLLKILAQRGINTLEEIDKFINPKLANLHNPFELTNMDKICDRLQEAIDKKQKVIFFGDYDVDGITSITILYNLLEYFGIKAKIYLPSRLAEGYGVSDKAIKNCFEKFKTADLFIALDCGTSSIHEFDWLKQRGVNALIIDHHEPSHDRLPECQAILNPKANDDENFTYLCTAGLAFKIAHAMMKKHQNREYDLKNLLDISAVGTIADIVPLIGENRIISRFGLKKLEHTIFPGIEALIKITAVKPPITASDVGFRIGPRINAAGRLDNAYEALELLLEKSNHKAWQIAQRLDNQNRERQTVEMRIVQEVENTINKKFKPEKDLALICGSESWHPGVVGIVASRVMRLYNRPCFIIAIDENGIGKGSGRSIEGISLTKAISECKELLINGGGHDMAAGITIEKKNISKFREEFNQAVSRQTGNKPLPALTVIDAEINLAEINLLFMDQYDKLRPFGNQNPTPVFLCRKVMPATTPKFINEKHLKVQIEQGSNYRDAIFFNFTEKNSRLPQPPWDIITTLETNEFLGSKSVQLFLKDIRESSETPYL